MEQLSKELGVTTFKLFMSQKGRLMLDNNEMMEAFKHIKDIGGVAKVSFWDFLNWKSQKAHLFLQVHAENGDIIAENQRRLLARGVTGPEGHPAAQPQEVEGG